jgi:hypothetical protein
MQNDATLKKAIEVISEGKWKPEMIGLCDKNKNSHHSVEFSNKTVRKLFYSEIV